MNILLVDDEPIVLESLLLTPLGSDTWRSSVRTRTRTKAA